MGESERYIDRKFKKIALGEDHNALMALIAINGIGFLILGLTQVIYYIVESPNNSFASDILPWFMMPAKLSSLAKAPWTVLTNMFFHTGIIITFTNMLWLWAFGSIFQEIAGNRKLIPVYIYGGLLGSVVFIATSYAIPPLRNTIDHAWLLGANASIMAIAVASTTLAPNYRLFKMLNGGIPIWVLTLLYLIIDFAGIGSSSAAYYMAHLAGGVAGYLFIVTLKNGLDLSIWMNNFYNWSMNLFNPYKKASVAPSVKEKMFYKTGSQKPFVKRSIITQQVVDEILDKINQKGFNHLTDEEKNILKRAGEIDY